MKKLKKNFEIILVIFITIFNISCSTDTVENTEFTQTVFTDTLDQTKYVTEELMESPEVVLPEYAIPMQNGDLQKLITHVQEKGFVVEERGIYCDHQLTFYDSKGNRHAIIAAKRDKSKKPSLTGTVGRMHVWAYKDGIKDSDHYFGYVIGEESIRPTSPPYDGIWTERSLVQEAIAELLAQTN